MASPQDFYTCYFAILLNCAQSYNFWVFNLFFHLNHSTRYLYYSFELCIQFSFSLKQKYPVKLSFVALLLHFLNFLLNYDGLDLALLIFETIEIYIFIFVEPHYLTLLTSKYRRLLLYFQIEGIFLILLSLRLELQRGCLFFKKH